MNLEKLIYPASTLTYATTGSHLMTMTKYYLQEICITYLCIIILKDMFRIIDLNTKTWDSWLSFHDHKKFISKKYTLSASGSSCLIYDISNAFYIRLGNENKSQWAVISWTWQKIISKKYAISICFVRLWKTSLWSIWMTILLLHHSDVGMDRWVPTSAKIHRSQTNSWFVSGSTRYLLSILKWAVRLCFLLLHDIRESPRKK